ncbi:MAG: hypothetical protein LBL19_06170 [Spirochaetaceae bacterium]|jgi:hypothetical protein|nr:hypothetical protein [Spirochaetaceae bacterium]
MKAVVRAFVVISVYFTLASAGYAEEFRVQPQGTLEVSREGTALIIPYNGSVIVSLGEDQRFFRGIEIELTAPAEWLQFRGSLAVPVYSGLEALPPAGPDGTFVPGQVLDLTGTRFFYDLLPAKLQIAYQIPLRPGHGLRSSPYAQVLSLVPAPSFPILFRLTPVVKGIGEELEKLRFRFSVKPILGDEGAVRLRFRYPRQLLSRPFTLLIDDQVVEDPAEELLLKEGEHHLIILSDDYRNESRFFLVERAKILDLSIELQDPTPLLIFEGPEKTTVFLDNQPVEGSVPVEPGIHEIRFQVSDYTVVRNIRVERGKTYRVALTVDIDVSESE